MPWGSLQPPIDLSYWLYWDSGDQYLPAELVQSTRESRLTSPLRQHSDLPLDLTEEEGHYTPDSAVLPLPVRLPSSSTNKAVIPTAPSPPDDFREFQDLLHRVAGKLQIPLEEVQDSQHKILDLLHSSGSNRIALPVNVAVRELARQGCANCPPAFPPTRG